MVTGCRGFGDEQVDHDAGTAGATTSPHDRGEVGSAAHTVLRGQHLALPPRVARGTSLVTEVAPRPPRRGWPLLRAATTCGSGGDLGAALAPARGEDGAPGTGAHPEAETMHLGAATGVGLEGPLAHGTLFSLDPHEVPVPDGSSLEPSDGWAWGWRDDDDARRLTACPARTREAAATAQRYGRSVPGVNSPRTPGSDEPHPPTPGAGVSTAHGSGSHHGPSRSRRGNRRLRTGNSWTSVEGAGWRTP